MCFYKTIYIPSLPESENLKYGFFRNGCFFKYSLYLTVTMGLRNLTLGVKMSQKENLFILNKIDYISLLYTVNLKYGLLLVRENESEQKSTFGALDCKPRTLIVTHLVSM